MIVDPALDDAREPVTTVSRRRVPRVFIATLLAGIACQVVSYAFFHGVASSLYLVCGSACEIWPGIHTA